LSLYEYYRSNTTVQLVLQYCEGGEVLDTIAQRRGLSENEAKVIMKQTFDALRHCHMMNICHRDLKPQNLLLRNSIDSGREINERTAHVVICDFGVSTIVSNQRLRKLIGTVSYMAPEVFHRNYDISCDVWSAGVILFQLLSGFKPFENRRDIEMDSTAALERAFRKHPELWHSRVSASCKSLIKRLLQLDATRRPSCDDILRLDPWFRVQNRKSHRTYSNESYIYYHNNTHTNTATEKKNLDRNVYDSLALKALCSSQKVTKFQHQMALSLADDLMKHQNTNKEGELLRQFQMLDIDGDGVISPKELQVFFKHSKYENSVADLLRRADLDHDDRISYREVLVLALERVSWNVPLRREDLSRRVGLSSSDVDIVQQRVRGV